MPTSTQNILATWFVGDKAGEETAFPQIGLLSSTYNFQRIYWNCIYVFFTSATIFDPDSTKFLYIDSLKNPLLQERRAELEALGVTIRELPFLRRPPKGFSDSFGNQLYIVDIINDLTVLSAWNSCIVLDSDCILMRPIEDLWQDIGKHGIATLELGPVTNENINGLSERDLQQLAYEAKWVPTTQTFRYYGGEFFGVTHEYLEKLCPILNFLLEENLVRWSQGKTSIKEEAHLLSIAYAHLAIESANASKYLKRIWTTFKYSTVEKSDLQLSIWHMPSEKRTGMVALYGHFKQFKDDPKKWAQNKEFAKNCGKFLGIPRRTFRKFIFDSCSKLKQKITEKKRL